MKKAVTGVFILATFFVACTKETPSEGGCDYVDVTFGAKFDVTQKEDEAKTMLDDDLSVLWCEGDKIAVNNDGWNGAKKNMDLDTFTSTVDSSDPHKASFSGKINSGASKFIAMYPAANVKLGSILNAGVDSDGKVYMVLPNSQTAREGSFTNGCALSYAMGSVSGGVIQGSVTFKNLCSVLEFTMPDYVVGAQSVRIQSNNGALMSGGCVIDRKDFKFNSFGPSDEKDATHNFVTVTNPNTANKFYAVIFPGNYASGFTITVTTAGGQVYSRNVTKALNAKANHIYNLGTLGVVLDEQKVELSVNIVQNIKSGSIATFNIAGKDDFKAMVKSWDINLYNSKDQLVRKIEGNTTGSGTLQTVGDFKLLAAGDYYAKVSYCMKTGSKRPAIVIPGISAPQFKVEGVVVNANTELNYNGGVLNGTDVNLSFDTSAVDPEIAALINWTEVTLKDVNGVVYRTATAAGLMNPASGKPYLPNGTYTLAAHFTLPALGSTEPTALDPKQITVNHAPAFGVSLASAKTSYDYYVAGDINKANGCNNMGIYELAANVTGISDAVKTQMAGNFSYEWFLDGNSTGKTENTNASVSGISQNTNGAVKVAFGSKNVSCKATFQGGNATSGNVAVDITGLPYSYSFPNNTSSIDNAGWKRNGSTGVRGDGFLTYQKKAIGYSAYSGYVNSPRFNIPANVKTTCSISHRYYSSSGLTTSTKMGVYINAVDSNTKKVTSPNSFNRSATADTTTGSKDCQKDSGIIVTLTPSDCYYCLANSETSTGSWCSYFVYGFEAKYKD